MFCNYYRFSVIYGHVIWTNEKIKNTDGMVLTVIKYISTLFIKLNEFIKLSINYIVKTDKKKIQKENWIKHSV